MAKGLKRKNSADDDPQRKAPEKKLQKLSVENDEAETDESPSSSLETAEAAQTASVADVLEQVKKLNRYSRDPLLQKQIDRIPKEFPSAKFRIEKFTHNTKDGNVCDLYRRLEFVHRKFRWCTAPENNFMCNFHEDQEENACGSLQVSKDVADRLKLLGVLVTNTTAYYW
eukprot:GHVP01022772.1.p1 GENE.GHVP01022772.1~~GHVP01022772.1.p1  ORF type:complete len:181 (+),score=32.42 GHVP01022772.1:35-544(+)